MTVDTVSARMVPANRLEHTHLINAKGKVGLAPAGRAAAGDVEAERVLRPRGEGVGRQDQVERRRAGRRHQRIAQINTLRHRHRHRHEDCAVVFQPTQPRTGLPMHVHWKTKLVLAVRCDGLTKRAEPISLTGCVRDTSGSVAVLVPPCSVTDTMVVTSPRTVTVS
jgi:hypothetical protein